MKLSKIASAVALAAAALAPTAQAAFINGSVSFSGGLNAPPAYTNYPAAVVSQIVTADTNGGIIVTGAGVGNLSSLTFGEAGTANDFAVNAGTPLIFTIDGFTFSTTSLVAGTLLRNPLTCDGNNNCNDTLRFEMQGNVVGNSFDLTDARYAFVFTGTCTGTPTAGPCTDTPNGSYSVSINANGRAAQLIPEPGSMALIGLALAGLGASGLRRRKAS